MKRVFGAALVLAMMLSVTSIAFAETGSIEVGGHILGTDNPVAQYHITYHANGGRGPVPETLPWPTFSPPLPTGLLLP